MAERDTIPGNSMSNEANSNSKVNVLAKPRLTPSTISTGLNSNNPFGSVSSFSTGNSIFGQKSVLRPSQLSNPFGTVTSSSTDNDKQSTSSGTASSSNASQSSSEVNSSTDNKSETVIPKFVPLHSSKDKVSFSGGTVGGASPSGLTRAAGFVFGQNLAERIEKNTENGNAETSSSSNHITSNGTSELLFSTAVQASADSQSTLIKVDNTGSLEQSAQAWAKSRDTTPIVPPASIITGEEGETNILQLNCRLFAFENGLWKERGRGQLRINDGSECSRIVCRVIGSLRVLLNTKIWGDMMVEKAGSKSLRITATDSELKVKVFLIMATTCEINQLYNVINRRVIVAKKNEESDPKTISPDSSNDQSNKADTTESLDGCSPYPKEPEDCSLTNSDGNDDEESQTEREEMVVSQSVSNPSVVVSTEDETQSSSGVKRSIGSDEGNEPPRKIPNQKENSDQQL